MNILQINKSGSRGGAASVAFRLAMELERRSHGTTLWIGDQDERMRGFHYISADVEFGRLADALSWMLRGRPCYSTLKSQITSLLANDIQFFPMRELEHTAEFRDADVVHCHNLHGAYFDLQKLAAYSRAKPLVWTLHDMWALTGHCAHSVDCDRWKTGCGDCPSLSTFPAIAWDNTRYLWRRKREIFAQCHLTVVVPSLWLKRLVADSILGHLPCELVHNGVDARVFRPRDRAATRSRLSLPVDKTIFVFVAHGGRRNTWKGFDHVERAIGRFRSSSDIHFVCIGSDGGEASPLPCVTNVGYVDDENLLSQYYAASDALLFPSLAENFPLVVLESMACGTPVVGFDVGGVGEVLDHRRTGYLARRGDSDDFTDGVGWILGLSVREKRAMSERCRKVIEDDFTLEKMVDAYLRVYELALSSERLTSP